MGSGVPHVLSWFINNLSLKMLTIALTFKLWTNKFKVWHTRRSQTSDNNVVHLGPQSYKAINSTAVTPQSSLSKTCWNTCLNSSRILLTNNNNLSINNQSKSSENAIFSCHSKYIFQLDMNTSTNKNCDRILKKLYSVITNNTNFNASSS